MGLAVAVHDVLAGLPGFVRGHFIAFLSAGTEGRKMLLILRSGNAEWR